MKENAAESTRADPAFPARHARTRGFVRGLPTRPVITPDGSTVVFLRSLGDAAEQSLYALDLTTGNVRELCSTRHFLADPSAERLTEAERARRERLRISANGIVDFFLLPNGNQILVPLAGGIFVFDWVQGTSRVLVPADWGVDEVRPSADGKRCLFVRQYDLYWIGLDQGPAAPVRITPGGSAERFYARAEFVAQEEMARSAGYWISPDGQQVLVTEVDERAVECFTIADYAHPEAPPLHFRYPRPGRANAEVRLLLFDLDAGGVGRPVEWDRQRYPYLARVSWDGAGAPALALVQSRDQREAAVLILASDGTSQVVHREVDAAWLNLLPGLPRMLPHGAGFLMPSERSGRRVLEWRDRAGRLLKCPISEAVLRSEEEFLGLADVHVIAGETRLLVTVGDALSSRVLDVSLGTGAARPLTTDDADYAVAAPAHAQMVLVCRTARDAYPQVRVLCRADGSTRAVVPATCAEPGFVPRLQYLRVPLAEPLGGAPTAHDIHAVVIRPRSFEPGRCYPVVLHVYGGPHALMVRSDARHYLLDQWLADHGVIVVALDNCGTPRRGRAFERAIKGSLGPRALADQVAGLAALAECVPELDLTRVGVYGWSFGGTLATLAVLCRPDLFKVAVAGAPVVDWLDYDTHYTERYLDLPEVAPEAYRDSSPLTYADRLTRPLLLIHGTADDNVYFCHSLKLCEALLRAGRSFDFMPLPGMTHQVVDPTMQEMVTRRTAEYLLRHLEVSDFRA